MTYTPPEPKRTVAFRVPAKIREELERRAVELGVTLSDVCETALTIGVNQFSGEKLEDSDQPILKPVDLDNISGIFESVFGEVVAAISAKGNQPAGEEPDSIQETFLGAIDDKSRQAIETYISNCLKFAESKGIQMEKDELVKMMLFQIIEEFPEKRKFSDGDILEPKYIFKPKK